MAWEVGGRFKREGINVNLWLIHVDAWQKSSHCKTVIFQLKINKILKAYLIYLKTMTKQKRYCYQFNKYFFYVIIFVTAM